MGRERSAQVNNKRRPILMGRVEQVATGTEGPCPDRMTQSLLERVSIKPTDPNALVPITPKCHRTSGMRVGYSWSDGCAVLICAQCGAGVARLLLAVEVPS